MNNKPMLLVGFQVLLLLSVNLPSTQEYSCLQLGHQQIDEDNSYGFSSEVREDTLSFLRTSGILHFGQIGGSPAIFFTSFTC
jgi:hypothetical protein